MIAQGTLGAGDNKMNKQEHGFTMIEMVLVLVTLGVVGMMAIPEYVDASQQALHQSKWQMSVSVKQAHEAMQSQQGALPSVESLAARLPAAQPVAGGVVVQMDEESYTVPTYANSLCTVLTTSVNDQVGCVGDIL